jgi:hypothetical protein
MTITEIVRPMETASFHAISYRTMTVTSTMHDPVKIRALPWRTIQPSPSKTA